MDWITPLTLCGLIALLKGKFLSTIVKISFLLTIVRMSFYNIGQVSRLLNQRRTSLLFLFNAVRTEFFPSFFKLERLLTVYRSVVKFCLTTNIRFVQRRLGIRPSTGFLKWFFCNKIEALAPGFRVLVLMGMHLDESVDDVWKVFFGVLHHLLFTRIGNTHQKNFRFF